MFEISFIVLYLVGSFIISTIYCKHYHYNLLPLADGLEAFLFVLVWIFILPLLLYRLIAFLSRVFTIIGRMMVSIFIDTLNKLFHYIPIK